MLVDGSRGGRSNKRGERHSRTSGRERRQMVIWSKTPVEGSTMDGLPRPVRPHSYHTRAQWETPPHNARLVGTEDDAAKRALQREVVRFAAACTTAQVHAWVTCRGLPHPESYGPVALAGNHGHWPYLATRGGPPEKAMPYQRLPRGCIFPSSTISARDNGAWG